MDKPITEKRQFPRISVTFPLQITPDFLGRTVDLSEVGLRFILEKPLLLTKAKAKIELSPEEAIETELKVIWGKHLVKENKFTYGACFIRLKEKELAILRSILSRYPHLNIKFVDLVKRFKGYLKSIKAEFDAYDLSRSSEKDKISFIESKRKEIFNILDMYFKNLWDISNDFKKEEYKLHQKYAQTMLWPLLREPVETNRLVCDKPFGYAGDFMVMNYIYEYHNKYLGKTLYEKLINFYTCNIPIAISVVKRKNFIKKKIKEISENKKGSKILSVGSGPARELIELMQEDREIRSIYFDCLDFEKKALDYVQTLVEKNKNERKHDFFLRFINKNIVDLVRNEDTSSLFKKYSLIYSLGLFDYLSDRLAKRLIKVLFGLLEIGGILIITNVKKEEITHRIYYEMLGEWYLHYRTGEDLLSWVRDIPEAEIKLEDKVKGSESFLFLILQRKNRR